MVGFLGEREGGSHHDTHHQKGVFFGRIEFWMHLGQQKKSPKILISANVQSVFFHIVNNLK